jgi:hypothetical protein
MPGPLRKKSTLVLLFILGVVFAWFVVKTYSGAVEQNATRAVAAKFGFAMSELQKTPPGIARVETFLVRLKAIDTTRAAPEVRQTLRDYIAALEPSLNAARHGQSIAPYDQAIARAKQRLVDAVRESE